MTRSKIAEAMDGISPKPGPVGCAAICSPARITARVLHLTNWTGNKLERPGANEYYLAPVENVRIRMAVPKGKRVRDVALLVKAPFKKDVKGPSLEIVIPRVEAYQAVRVTLE